MITVWLLCMTYRIASALCLHLGPSSWAHDCLAQFEDRVLFFVMETGQHWYGVKLGNCVMAFRRYWPICTPNPKSSFHQWVVCLLKGKPLLKGSDYNSIQGMPEAFKILLICRNWGMKCLFFWLMGTWCYLMDLTFSCRIGYSFSPQSQIISLKLPDCHNRTDKKLTNLCMERLMQFLWPGAQ